MIPGSGKRYEKYLGQPVEVGQRVICLKNVSNVTVPSCTYARVLW